MPRIPSERWHLRWPNSPRNVTHRPRPRARRRPLASRRGGRRHDRRDAGIRQQLPRATKNHGENHEGTRRAHLRDGRGGERFPALGSKPPRARRVPTKMARRPNWSMPEGGWPARLFRKPAARHLLRLRSRGGPAPERARISFTALTGPAPTGRSAMCELYLGGFRRPVTATGTPDITRTVAVGTPTTEDAAALPDRAQGPGLAISTLRFPEGTRGRDIDAFARRRALAGRPFDYAAHWHRPMAVGSCPVVHEGPQRISRIWASTSSLPGIDRLQRARLLQGRRLLASGLENLIVVEEARAMPRRICRCTGFETLTLGALRPPCPVDPLLLGPMETHWSSTPNHAALVGRWAASRRHERSWLGKKVGRALD